MLQINEAVALKIIDTYNILWQKEKDNVGSQSKTVLEYLYQIVSFCEKALDICYTYSHLQSEIRVFLTPEMVNNLAYVNELGYLHE